MKSHLFIFCFTILIMNTSFEALAQEKEINYIWIDTVVKIEGKDARLVSNDIVEISCCMKSPKYSRVSSKAAKWIKENFDQAYTGKSPFKSLQDSTLALHLIAEARKKSDGDQSIRMVEYEFKCN